MEIVKEIRDKRISIFLELKEFLIMRYGLLVLRLGLSNHYSIQSSLILPCISDRNLNCISGEIKYPAPNRTCGYDANSIQKADQLAYHSNQKKLR